MLKARQTVTAAQKKSKQRKWQEKMRALGLCEGCGADQPVPDTSFCPKCTERRQEVDRKRRGCKAWRPGKPGRPPKRMKLQGGVTHMDF